MEYAHLLNASGNARDAIAQYRLALQKGREGKYSTFQPELASWGLGVALRGQHEFVAAASAFDLVGTGNGVDPVLIDRANVSAGEMYDTLRQRDLAVARYRKVIEAGREGEYLSAAHKHLRHPYQFTEQPTSAR
jgi:lipopolysaccharide biosynthesis regulator YciM